MGPETGAGWPWNRGDGGGSGSEKTMENVRFGGFRALGHTGARAVFWENFAGAVLAAFGGRFWGLFRVVFVCFWNFFRVNLELFFGQSLRTTFIVSEQLPLWLCSLTVLRLALEPRVPGEFRK